MNDHNLDDLIIDNIEPKNGKAKSLLTIFALLIIVLIVGIILTKIIVEDPKKENAMAEENNTEMISPELRLQNVGQKIEKKEETKLSSIIEKELNEPVKAPEVKEVIETTKSVQIQKNEAEKIEEKVPEVVEVKETVTKPMNVEITKEFDQTVEKPEIKEPATQEKKQTPAKKQKAETSTSASEQIYYIQVGSFSKTPVASSRLLRSVKNNGFKYRIKTTGKMKKVQIGPFKSRSSANNAIVRVKDRINKSAYVVKK